MDSQRIVAISASLAMACLVGVAARASAFDFSAERIARIGERAVVAHVYAGDDRWRLEYAQPQSGASTAIVRRDQECAWLLFGRTKTYLDVPLKDHLLRDHFMLLVDETMEGEVFRERIGTEQLNGRQTEVFEVTVERNGQHTQYYQWVTLPERFAIKTISKDGEQRVEYRHINFAKQPDRYFELPMRYGRTQPRP